MIDHDGLKDRIIGSFLGLAVGDALGGPVENMTAEEIARLCPNGLIDYPAVPASGLSPGDVTDDTEMALFVAHSLIANSGLEMDDIVRRLLNWADEQPGQLGPSTSKGVGALRMGSDWRQTGSTEKASSGVLPRTVPLALALPPEQVVSASVLCSAPTHRHPMAIACAVAQNIVLCALVNGVDWSEAVAFELPEQIETDSAECLRAALAAGTGEEGAVAVLAEAFHCVNAAATAQIALEKAVLMGGDTDTRAAIAGALAGARWGSSMLPGDWVNGCSAHNEVASVARDLAALHVGLNSAHRNRLAVS